MIDRLHIVCGGPTTASRKSHLRKFFEILTPLFAELIIISEEVPPTSSLEELPESLVSRFDSERVSRLGVAKSVFRYMSRDLQKAEALYSSVRSEDRVLFLGIFQPLPLLVCKLRGCHSILFGGGFDISRYHRRNRILEWISFWFRWVFQVTMLCFFDSIVVESASVVDFFNLGRFVEKIETSGHLFVHPWFTREIPIESRTFDVGYVGALHPDKGIHVFIDSVMRVDPYLLNKVLVIGSGPAEKDVIRLSRNHVGFQVTLINRAEYNDMPNLLGSTKILLMPSRSEGLPNVALEAMACGTPVAATRVGALPEIIIDCKTGFLLDTTSPDYIASRLNGLLRNHQILDSVGLNASLFVKKYFGLAAARRNWKRILSE